MIYQTFLNYYFLSLLENLVRVLKVHMWYVKKPSFNSRFM